MLSGESFLERIFNSNSFFTEAVMLFLLCYPRPYHIGTQNRISVTSMCRTTSSPSHKSRTRELVPDLTLCLISVTP